jgi:hypothetical protein
MTGSDHRFGVVYYIGGQYLVEDGNCGRVTQRETGNRKGAGSALFNMSSRSVCGGDE